MRYEQGTMLRLQIYDNGDGVEEEKFYGSLTEKRHQLLSSFVLK